MSKEPGPKKLLKDAKSRLAAATRIDSRLGNVPQINGRAVKSFDDLLSGRALAKAMKDPTLRSANEELQALFLDTLPVVALWELRSIVETATEQKSVSSLEVSAMMDNSSILNSGLKEYVFRYRNRVAEYLDDRSEGLGTLLADQFVVIDQHGFQRTLTTAIDRLRMEPEVQEAIHYLDLIKDTALDSYRAQVEGVLGALDRLIGVAEAHLDAG